MTKIKLFAQLGELIQPEINLELPAQADRAAILTAIANSYPLAADEIKKSNVAVNQTYIYDGAVALGADSEIAIIPPVSGG